MRKLTIGLLSLPFLAQAQDCVLPDSITAYDYPAKATVAEGKDWENPKMATDYWMLAVSWSKGFCDSYGGEYPEAKKHQCVNNEFGFVVHGLWAQSKHAGADYTKHPRNCVDAPAIGVETLKDYLCVLPGVELIQKEWEKHGTCDYKKPEPYLAQTAELYRQINWPTRDEVIEVERTDADTIKQLIISKNPKAGLKAEHMNVSMGREGKRLAEVYVCYDMQFKFKSCL